MADSGEPPFSIEKRGFFISNLVVDQKAAHKRDGPASLDQPFPLLSNLYSVKREYAKAIAEGEWAVALAPSGALAHEFYALSLVYACRPEEAIPLLQKAIRLNPFSPTTTFLHYGHALRGAGRFEEAVSAYKKAIQRAPDNIFAHIGLTATYSMMGREEEARTQAAEVLRISPKFSVDSYAKRIAFKDQTVADKFLDALRQAGLK